MKAIGWLALAAAIIATPALAASVGRGPPLAGPSLGSALRAGGYVLVVRHAHAPTEPPTAATADPANPARERQLDAAGKTDAAMIGQGVRALGLSVWTVLSSPAFRAVQTVQAAGWSAPRIVEELGDAGRSMRPVGGDPAAWLRRQAATAPAPGADAILVTHQPNIVAAFGLTDVAEGEALVFRPGGAEPTLVARIKPGDWAGLR